MVDVDGRKRDQLEIVNRLVVVGFLGHEPNNGERTIGLGSCLTKDLE
jgi:hypothetical protein